MMLYRHTFFSSEKEISHNSVDPSICDTCINVLFVTFSPSLTVILTIDSLYRTCPSLLVRTSDFLFIPNLSCSSSWFLHDLLLSRQGWFPLYTDLKGFDLPCLIRWFRHRTLMYLHFHKWRSYWGDVLFVSDFPFRYPDLLPFLILISPYTFGRFWDLRNKFHYTSITSQYAVPFCT